jgi:hypothetical protein
MAGRPRKQIVDYFPHDTGASHGRTLTILQNKFGNDGVIVWWRILEMLGRSEGLVYHCDDSDNWEYLVAEMHVTDISVTEILNLLAKLGAIDAELWGQKTIWCQNFVDRLSQIFNKRKDDLPSRPVISVTDISISVTDIPPLSIPMGDLKLNSTTPFPHTPIPQPPKVKQSKVKVENIKRKKKIPIELPDWIDKKIWDAYLEMRRGRGKAPTQYAIEQIARSLTAFREQGQDPNEILNQSIINSWIGVFPLKEGRNNGHKRDSEGLPGNRPSGAFADIEP